MQITRGKIPGPVKVLIYGPEGIGKSTLASRFPDPVFIDTEGSTNHMDVARLPAPSSWSMLKEEIEYIKQNPSSCKTLVVDTADWAEKMCIESVCASKKVDGIESIGYGKGYVYVKEEFGKMLNLLNDVLEKGINIVVTAHAQMRKFEQPDELGAYDRWELKMEKKTAPLVKEWADMILFCNYKTMVINVDNQGAQKGKNKAQGGRRVMYTSHHPCWDAKNRFGLPEELDMTYDAIRAVVEGADLQNRSANAVPAAEKQHKPTEPPVTQRPAAPPVNAEAEQMTLPGMDDPIANAIHMTPEQAKTELKTAQGITSPPPDEDPEVPSKSTEPKKPPEATEAPPAAAPVSKYFSSPENIPKKLRDLMEQDNICEWDIQAIACDMKGYFPPNTLIEDMEKSQPGFIEGWILAYWPTIKDLVKEMKEKQEIPFL